MDPEIHPKLIRVNATTSAQSGRTTNNILVVQIYDRDVGVCFRIIARGFTHENLDLLRGLEQLCVDLEGLAEPALQPHAQPDEATVTNPWVAFQVKTTWEQNKGRDVE